MVNDRVKKKIREEVSFQGLSRVFELFEEFSEGKLQYIRSLRDQKLLKFANLMISSQEDQKSFILSQIPNMMKKEKIFFVRATVIFYQWYSWLYSEENLNMDNTFQELFSHDEISPLGLSYLKEHLENKSHIPIEYLEVYKKTQELRSFGEPWKIKKFKWIKSFLDLSKFPSGPGIDLRGFFKELRALSEKETSRNPSDLNFIYGLSLEASNKLQETRREALLSVVLHRIRRLLKFKDYKLLRNKYFR